MHEAAHSTSLASLMPEPLALEPSLEPAAALISAAQAAPSSADEAPTEIAFVNVNTRESMTLSVSPDGRVSEQSEPLVEAFFACRRSGRAHAIEPGVLRVVAAVARQYPGRTIEVVSGFRTKPYGVKDSKHFEGRAIDLRVRGVKLTKVRDFVWRNFADIGVGYYGHQNFIHVDHRPDKKDTAWTSAYENAPYEFNPRWATRIRPPWMSPSELAERLEQRRTRRGALAQNARASVSTAL